MSVARWLRVDLHAHTPFDETRPWGRTARATREKNIATVEGQVVEWLDRCVEAGIDIVAVTDHNTLAGYDEIRQGFDDWRAEHVADLLVLPGVELHVAGCHFLVVGGAEERDTLHGLIGRAFGASPPVLPSGEPNEAELSVIGLARAVDEAVSNGHDIVALPAHVNRDKGLVTVLEGLMRQRAFAQRAWSGFQVRGTDFHNSRDLSRLWASARLFGRHPDELNEHEKEQLREFVQRNHWPFIDASDPKGLADLGAIFTWMKMSVPGVEGIRQALLDPESRLRRHAEAPPEPPATWIERIEIGGVRTEDEQLLFGGALAVELSPALNAVIGGRGTGKSTILELLRWALDRARPDDFSKHEHGVRDQVQDFLSQTKGVLRDDTRVRVTLQREGPAVLVERTAGVLLATPVDGRDEWDARTLVEPRIVSQGQISGIARDERAILREVDQAVAGSLREWLERRGAPLRELEDLQRQRRDLTARLLERSSVETSIHILEDKIARLEEAANSEVLHEYRRVGDQGQWLSEVLDSLSEALLAVPRLRVLPEGWPSPPLPGPADALLAALNEELLKRGTVIERQRTALTESIVQTLQRVTGIRDRDFATVKDPLVKAYGALVRTLREDGLEIGHLGALQAKLASERQQARSLEQIPTDLDRIQEQIRAALNRLDALHRERLELRAAVATRLEERDADIRIAIQPFGDSGELVERRERWWGGTGMRQDDWQRLVEWVYEADGEGVPTRWRRLVGAFRADHEKLAGQGDSAETVRKLGVSGFLSGYVENALRQVDQEQLDAMERFLPEDLVEAQFRDRDTFRPIARGSVGQRNTAVLSLLLTVGDGPLILDQPEDDLDNRYIYDVVVELLRATKTQRQIIVATHNANVPVNGDAEHIVALDPERDGSVPVLTGTLERPEIKEAVSNIMEGSEAAFRLRRERYGY